VFVKTNSTNIEVSCTETCLKKPRLNEYRKRQVNNNEKGNVLRSSH